MQTDRGNFKGDYPPVFYFFTSLFVGNDISFSVIAMRFANAALFVLMIAATYLASAPGLRRPLLLGTTITLVPLGMFIVPSINPSSWAVLSAATLAVSVLGYLTTEERRRRLVLGVLAAIALLLGAGARADAAMYSVIAIGAALIVTVARGGAYLRRAVYPVVLAVIAAASYFSSGQSSAVEGSAVQPFGLGAVARVLIDVPDLWVGALGRWGLGWLDTTMPALVWVSACAVFAGTLYAAVSGTDVRRRVAVGAVALAVWVVPAYVQYLASAPVGTGVQPRYILPLLTILAVIALARTRGLAFRLTAGQRWIMVAALSVANAVALHYNLRRYITGTDVYSLNLDAHEEWWWGMPVPPLGVFAVGALAFLVGLVLLSRELTVVSPAAREVVTAVAADRHVHAEPSALEHTDDRAGDVAGA